MIKGSSSSTTNATKLVYKTEEYLNKAFGDKLNAQKLSSLDTWLAAPEQLVARRAGCIVALILDLSVRTVQIRMSAVPLGSTQASSGMIVIIYGCLGC